LYRDGGTCWDYRLSHSIPHTSFIADFTRRYYNRSVTNSSLTNCVIHSLFPSTLLTVDYSRWRPTIHCRLSALVASSLANYSLGSHWLTLQTNSRPPDSKLTANCSATTTPVTVWVQPKVTFVGPDRCHLVLPFINAFYGLVTGETSVVYSPCIAVGLFSE
jgi:hypothetical protein